MLVAEARRLRFASFARVMAYWSQCADPDGAEEAACDQRHARRLHLSQSFAGSWVGDLFLDPIAGTIVSKAMSGVEDELFEADWADPSRCLPCWWAMRPSPGASASWPTAPW